MPPGNKPPIRLGLEPRHFQVFELSPHRPLVMFMVSNKNVEKVAWTSLKCIGSKRLSKIILLDTIFNHGIC